MKVGGVGDIVVYPVYLASMTSHNSLFTSHCTSRPLTRRIAKQEEELKSRTSNELMGAL